MIHIEPIVCVHITDDAMHDLKRAGVQIEKDVPGLESNQIIVLLIHYGEQDRTGLLVWDVREIQIQSHNLCLEYYWSDEHGGYVLAVIGEPGDADQRDMQAGADENLTLAALEEHPF